MKFMLKTLCATSLLALATACSTPEVDRLGNAQPTGSAFNQQLTAEYRLLARYEADNMLDFGDAEHFAEKGMKAARNESTHPDEIWQRELPAEHVAELTQARGRLTEVFERDAKNRYPREAATAQAKFDCWLEQQEENYQPKDIAACRDAFTTALQTIQSKQQAQLTSDRQLADTSRSADRTPPATAAAPETLVFFDFDEAEVPERESKKLDTLASAIGQKQDAFTVTATGHTDRAGTDAYNEALSVRRAEAVRAALIARGVQSAAIVVDGKGETAPMDPTPDGVRDAENRRVRVIVR